jgi:hypothetical protein
MDIELRKTVIHNGLEMNANGPAIKGGCVPDAAIRSVSWYFSRNLSRWQDRYGVLFANPGVSFIALRRDRGISFQVDEYLSKYTNFGKRPAAQCRGISYPGATICLGIRSFITCRGAYPDLRLKTDPDKRLIISKKHDKQLTFIVRVRCCC